MMSVQKFKATINMQWWFAVEPAVTAFSELVDHHPRTRWDQASQIALQLKEMYRSVQYASCPPDVAAAFVSVSDAMLCLFLCYDALTHREWSHVNIFYERAIIEWVLATRSLQAAGLMRYA